jgi:hypothetical protein
MNCGCIQDRWMTLSAEPGAATIHVDLVSSSPDPHDQWFDQNS